MTDVSILAEAYEAVYHAHQVKRQYSFHKESYAVYVAFSDSVVDNMNKQLEEGVTVDDNQSKDTKIFYAVY